MGLLVLLVSVVGVLLSIFTSSIALTPDGKRLLEMKWVFNDSQHFLSSWKESDSTPCNWTGITCHPQDHTVTSINLPFMQLGGVISPSIGKLRRLRRLALHANSLHGSIPTKICNCNELRALYLRANYFEGNIPAEIGKLSHLMILDLSSNSLGGTIPSSIGELTRLRFLNLSTNFFSGEIPDNGVLGTFRNTSFIGNLDLCGKQLQNVCRSSLGFPAVVPHADSDAGQGIPTVPTRRLSHYLNGILIGAMMTMGLALAMLLAFLWICLLPKKGKGDEKYSKAHKQLELPQDSGVKLVTFQGDLPYSKA